jgi:hypothetical protein
MTGPEFRALITRLGDAWTAGSAKAAAACFAKGVDYADPLRYRFATRESLLPFFEPPPGGHSTTWRRVLFDEAAQAGAVEYTYHGHHRYHGAAIVEVDETGLIRAWREWQHVDDELDWAGFVAGPGAGPAAGPGD